MFGVKQIQISAAIIAMMGMMTACDNSESEKEETQEITYYQLDATIETDAKGNELKHYEYKYDDKGNIVWEYWKNEEYNDITESTYDEKGRYVKQKIYYEGDGNHELYMVFDFSYPDANTRILVASDADGNVDQKDITTYDAEGRILRLEVQYPDEATGELYTDFTIDYTYDEHGNATKKVYLSPYEEDYYCEEVTKYEYKTFGGLTQYTRVEESRTWDKSNYEILSVRELDYDEYGNNIRQVTYEGSDFNFVEDLHLAVNHEMLTEYTYGLVCVPAQPHCYISEEGFDQNGSKILSNSYKYSVHHTEQVMATRSIRNLKKPMTSRVKMTEKKPVRK